MTKDDHCRMMDNYYKKLLIILEFLHSLHLTMNHKHAIMKTLTISSEMQ